MLRSRFVLTLVLVLFFPALALANSTNVTPVYLHPGGNSHSGVFTYPYYFSISGGAPTALMCDSFANHVFPSEKWTASPVGGKTGSGPQEFIGFNPKAMVAPEPGRLLLLSTGLMGIGLVVRRKFACI